MMQASIRMPEAASGNFEAFFRAEYTRLARALFVITGDRYQAEEIAQEAFVALLEHWGRVSEMENPIGYLYRTALNRWRRHRRSLPRRVAAVVAGHESEALYQVETRDLIVRSLATLTERQRAA
jgi:RNA polymerase sigma-70 factor (ECF subfamily)